MSSLQHVRPALQPGRTGTPRHAYTSTHTVTTVTPITLAETVDHEALAYKAWQTTTGDFLARQMERLAQLIRFTCATSGEDHEARIDVMEQSVQEEAFERGYAEGRQAARSELGLTLEDRF